jgi:hypothetical protein
MSTLLQMYRGDTATFTVTLTDGTGAPLDLSGLDITFTAKRHLLDTVPFIQKTLADGGIEPAGASGDSGICTITIEPEDTSDLVATDRFLWDVQVDSGTDVRTALMGRLVVRMDVTTTTGSGS